MLERLTVIVVAYGQAPLVDACLRPLRGAVRLVVVDNSQRPEIEAVARHHCAEYVDPGANVGFAAGVNMGARAVNSGDDLLLLNPDASITATALRALKESLHLEPRLAAVAPELLHPTTNALERVLWPFPTPSGMWREALRLPARGSEGFLTGACLLIRREAWDDVGAFDERYFLYAEEADWQFRAVLRGWRVRQINAVRATHVGAASSDVAAVRERLFFAGTETYLRKWFGTSGWLSFRLAAIVGAALRSIAGNASTRRRARQRLWIFVQGPRRAAGLAAR